MIPKLTEHVAARLEGRPAPWVVGVAGAVAAGKSTVAAELAENLEARGVRTHVISTDGFLCPNAVLAERGLTMRKGFPETFDIEALVGCIDRIRRAQWPVEVSAYSHLVYDVLPDESTTLPEADAVVVEGVIVLQEPVVDHLDVAVYVHAEEADVKRWYTERFLALVEAARDDPASFYHPFAAMDDDAVRAFAESAWEGINAVNLREHILPSRDNADIVVHKDGDHTISRVEVREAN